MIAVMQELLGYWPDCGHCEDALQVAAGKGFDAGLSFSPVSEEVEKAAEVVEKLEKSLRFTASYSSKAKAAEDTANADALSTLLSAVQTETPGDLIPCLCGGAPKRDSETGNNVFEWIKCSLCGRATPALHTADAEWNAMNRRAK